MVISEIGYNNKAKKGNRMTELEYELLGKLGAALDEMEDCMNSIEESASMILILMEEVGETFYKVRDENLDEWTNMQKAEARIIEEKYKIKNKGESNA